MNTPEPEPRVNSPIIERRDFLRGGLAMVVSGVLGSAGEAADLKIDAATHAVTGRHNGNVFALDRLNQECGTNLDADPYDGSPTYGSPEERICVEEKAGELLAAYSDTAAVMQAVNNEVVLRVGPRFILNRLTQSGKDPVSLKSLLTRSGDRLTRRDVFDAACSGFIGSFLVNFGGTGEINQRVLPVSSFLHNAAQWLIARRFGHASSIAYGAAHTRSFVHYSRSRQQ